STLPSPSSSFILPPRLPHRVLPSFPTRRSSDLTVSSVSQPLPSFYSPLFCLDVRLPTIPPVENLSCLAVRNSLPMSAFTLRSRRLWWTAPIVLLVAGLALFWVLRNDAQADANLRTATVTLGNIEASITALGTLQPREYVDVGTQVSGQLLRLHVELGDQVEQGQLLAEIDPTLFEAKVNAVRAQLTSQRAQLKQ